MNTTWSINGTTPAEPARERDWLASYYPVKSDAGTVVGFNTVVQEITERKRAEEALQKAHDQLGRRVQERTAELEKVNVALRTEISERQQAEEALSESEERFRSLSTSSPIGIFQTDVEGAVVYTNPMWQHITGQTLEESLGSGWVNTIVLEDQDSIFAAWKTYTQEGREYSLEYCLVRPRPVSDR